MAIFRNLFVRFVTPRRDSKYFNVFLWLIPLIAGHFSPLKVRDLRLDLAKTILFLDGHRFKAYALKILNQEGG